MWIDYAHQIIPTIVVSVPSRHRRLIRRALPVRMLYIEVGSGETSYANAEVKGLAGRSLRRRHKTPRKTYYVQAQ